MRKSTWFLLLSALFFLSCSDDDEIKFPIGDLQLPDVDKLWEPGEKMTIGGTGFAANCEIWFGTTDPSLPKTIFTEVKDITVSPNKISFVVPELYGKQQVLLRQGGYSFLLGTVSFASRPIRYVDRIVYKEEGSETEYKILFRYDELNRITDITYVEDTQTTGVRTYTYGSELVMEYKETGYDTVSTADRKIAYMVSGGKIDFAVEGTDTTSYTYYSNKDLRASSKGHQYTWGGGNLVKVNVAQGDYKFIHTAYPIKGNLDWSAILGDVEAISDVFLARYGLFGNSNTNLLSDYSYVENEYTKAKYGFEYDLDDIGYVEHIREYSYDGDKKTQLKEYSVYYNE